MFIIALLTPGERINYMPGRFPDLPGKRPSRPCADSGVSMLSFYNGDLQLQVQLRIRTGFPFIR